ncbi:MAG: OPT/YSL family transporter, partial [Candidatus Babeliales bacterium]
VYSMIVKGSDRDQSIKAGSGFIASFLCSIAQNGIGAFKGVIPKKYALTLWAQLNISLPLYVWPMLWAVGFVAGEVLFYPLAVGLISRLGVMHMLTWWYQVDMSDQLMLGFCSGIVVGSSLLGIIRYVAHCSLDRVTEQWTCCGAFLRASLRIASPYLFLVTGCTIGLFWYLHFSLPAQLYLMSMTCLCVIPMVSIAGKIGLAQLGRFATFVMVPAMVLFQVTPLQLVMISLYVELVTGVTVDLLCGRKLGLMLAVDMQQMRTYQLFGLVVSSLCVSVVCWFLVSHMQLGSDQLFAHRAQARALLIGASHFDVKMVSLGMVYGALLPYLSVSPMLVLGGMLMPPSISLGLMAGALISLASSQREQWYPFWLGVFSGDSLGMIVSALF